MMVAGQTMLEVVGQMMPVAVRKLIGMVATMVVLIVEQKSMLMGMGKSMPVMA